MNAFKTIFFNKTNVKIFLFWDIRDKSAEKIIFSELRYKRIDRNFRKLFFDFGLSMPALFASVNWIRFQYINSYPLKTNLYIAYLHGVLKVILPKIIVAVNGVNTPIFGHLANSLPEVKFVGVYQFQMRKVSCNRVIPSLAEYYVFGKWDSDQLTNIGQLENRVHVTGSLYSGFDSYIKSKFNKILYDVCLISTITLREHKLIEDNEKILLQYLKKYVDEYFPEMRICVACRVYDKNTRYTLKRERKLYSDGLPGCNIDYIVGGVNGDGFSSYRAISASKIVISQNSTIAYEAMGWGHKTLFCQPLRSNGIKSVHIPLPLDLKYSVIDQDFTRFSKLINELFMLTGDQYKDNVKNNMEKYCYYDKSNPTHDIIRQRILSVS